MEKIDLKECVICGILFSEWGNNAMPLRKGQCCNNCNETYVIPLRLDRIYGRSNE
jgi:hypothetical protein|tara:strand:- start:308 stop:472 length:165 start_codon:yes stop_codon:yes gene_type:complete